MGRRGPKPAKHVAIARAALALFVERSVKGATTRAIAQRARSTEASLYRHYAGKDALARHVIGSCSQSLTRDLEAGMAGVVGARARLRAYVRAYVEFGRRNPLEHAFLLQARTQEWLGAWEAVAGPRRILSSVLAEGRASGEFDAVECPWLAEFLSGGLGRVCYPASGHRLNNGVSLPVEALADAVERIVGCPSVDTRRNGHVGVADEFVTKAPQSIASPPVDRRWNGREIG